MKATELMIGDWVINPVHNDCSKIESVYYDKELHCLVGTDGRFPQQYFNPIPLTEEIFRLNGFEYDDSENCWKLIEKDGRYSVYSIYVNTNRVSIYNWRNEEGERFTDACNKVNVHYKYVHQIQHALRLCGLNILADNFKVTLHG